MSKSSLVGDEVSAKSDDNRKVLARVLYRDEKRDLVLLELKRKKVGGIRLSSMSRDTLDFNHLGKFLISTHTENEGEISVVGTPLFDLTSTYAIGYLGSGLELRNGKNLVRMVQAESPASDAGIVMGDEVLSVNGIRISDPEAFVHEIRKHKPGQTIQLVHIRDGVEKITSIKLGIRPRASNPHIAEKFEDGKSIRRDGFNKIFVHHSKLKPAECGGPVFDLEGNFMGINMARLSRTSSLAVSPSEVLDFLNKAIHSY